jgi:hypothetical protein
MGSDEILIVLARKHRGSALMAQPKRYTVVEGEAAHCVLQIYATGKSHECHSECPLRKIAAFGGRFDPTEWKPIAMRVPRWLRETIRPSFTTAIKGDE